MASLFEKELEFVQLLCNPEYIRWLFKQGYFDKPEFKNYLEYLKYFKNSKYIKFLTFPQCLVVLDMLTNEDISEKLTEDTFYSKLADDQYNLWKHSN